jgi:hypothetical protein
MDYAKWKKLPPRERAKQARKVELTPDEIADLDKRIGPTIRKVKAAKKGRKKKLTVVSYGPPEFTKEIEDRLLKNYDLTIEDDDRPPPWQPQRTKPRGQTPAGRSRDETKAYMRSVMRDKKMKAENAAPYVAEQWGKDLSEADRQKLAKKLLSIVKH